jgi:5-methylcytosine-specific restriction endonuclease McrA
LPRTKGVRSTCKHRLTSSAESLCFLQTNRGVGTDLASPALVFQGAKQGWPARCDRALAEVCPFREEGDDATAEGVGTLVPCPHCKRRHREGSTSKRLCEEWNSVKSVLKQMRTDLPDARKYFVAGTKVLPYSIDTPDLVRRLIWLRVKQAVLRRDRYTCQDCQSEYGSSRKKVFDQTLRKGKGGYRWEYLEVHHIIPRSKMGSDHPGNLKTLCPTCHRKYTVELMVDYLGERRRERELIKWLRELPDEEETWDHRGE